MKLPQTFTMAVSKALLAIIFIKSKKPNTRQGVRFFTFKKYRHYRKVYTLSGSASFIIFGHEIKTAQSIFRRNFLHKLEL